MVKLARRRGVRRFAAPGGAALLVALASVILAPGALADHFLGYSSVWGGQIRYVDNTKYDGARQLAITNWNALGRVSILPLSGTYPKVLRYDDYSDSSDPRYAYYQWQPAPLNDYLRPNLYALDRVTPDAERTNTIRHVVVHETGHALGIGDHYDPKWTTTAIMYSYTGPVNSWIQAPLAHDRTDYYALW